MLASLKDWLVLHRSAILATIVATQNSHLLHGGASTVASVVVALFGG
jgi:hypothetical protein